MPTSAAHEPCQQRLPDLRRHNDRVGLMMGRKPSSDASVGGQLAQLGAGGGGCPAAPTGGAVDDAEQRSRR
jgi:hypothetical protein